MFVHPETRLLRAAITLSLIHIYTAYYRRGYFADGGSVVALRAVEGMAVAILTKRGSSARLSPGP